MKKKTLTILFGSLAIFSSAALSMLATVVHPAIPLLLGLAFVPILTLTALRQYSMPAALFLFFGMSGVSILLAPSIAWGILFAAAWLSGAMILRVATDVSVDLFSILFYGGTVYLALILLGVALVIKDHYGVYDFSAVFKSVEQAFTSLVTQVSDFYKQYLPSADFERLYAPLFAQLLKGAEAFVYQIITFGLVLFGGWYFFTLKISQNLCRLLPRRIAAAPIILYGVPREIAWCFIPLFIISVFIGETYYFAFEIALTLTGFLLVPAGVGLVDTFMHKWPRAVRTLLKTLMFLLAFLGHFLGSGITYTILMAGGLYISLFRRIEFRRTKGENKDE